eukprot:1009250_1
MPLRMKPIHHIQLKVPSHEETDGQDEQKYGDHIRPRLDGKEGRLAIMKIGLNGDEDDHVDRGRHDTEGDHHLGTSNTTEFRNGGDDSILSYFESICAGERDVDPVVDYGRGNADGINIGGLAEDFNPKCSPKLINDEDSHGKLQIDGH